MPPWKCQVGWARIEAHGQGVLEGAVGRVGKWEEGSEGGGSGGVVPAGAPWGVQQVAWQGVRQGVRQRGFRQEGFLWVGLPAKLPLWLQHRRLVGPP